MGGKKKTKWRKLPLEEFTNDCSKFKRKGLEETKSNCVKKVSCPEIVEENSQPLSNKCVADGLWYPNLIYNPVEVPFYHPNYMMSNDYYPSNEYMASIKDTVYLLFPASVLRSTQYASYDWRNERRRRRYNGYAEYAVIPEKKNVDDRRKNSSTPIKSFETKQFEKAGTENNRIEVAKPQKQDNQSKDRILDDSCGLINKMGLSKSERNEESPNRNKKVVDVCDVHSKVSKLDSKSNLTKNYCDLPNCSNNFETDNMKEEFNKVSMLEPNLSRKCPTEIRNAERITMEITNNNPIHGDIGVICNNSNNTFSGGLTSVKNENKVKEESFLNANMSATNCENSKSDQNNLPSLPNIINAITPYLDKNTDYASPLNNDRTQNFSSLHNTKNINECVSKIPSVSATRSAYLPYLYNTNSDVLESKITEKISPKSQPLFTNNSIYKLAFDESLTDQSDTESRSPSPIDPANRSPVDPESQVPSSLMSHEINVYEADSGDEAGSEDLELIPHRYESESFLNKSKHLYENKLSLAVELLRTKESLPYDAQFKRVIEDSQEFARVEKTGEVNMGFVDDLNSLDSIELESNNFATSDHKTIMNQCKTQNSPNYDIPLDDSLTNSYELADEAVAQSANHQGEEVNDGYRRQFRHYFSVVYPWNCCTIM